MSTLNDLLGKLTNAQQNGKGWTACCPAHDDQRSSLSITESNGKVLLFCHAGCSIDAIVKAAGLRMCDLFTEPQPHKPGSNGRPKGKGNIVAEYDYATADGKLLYQVCRFEPKDFRQRRPDGNGGWDWKLGDVDRVLYRLPDLAAADPSKKVFIVEGEKDADRLRDLGLVATTACGGAGKWRDAYNEALRGREVIIIPDNDATGEQHAEQVAQALVGVAKAVQITTLPNVPPKGDVSDWLGEFMDGRDLLRLTVVRRKRFAASGSASVPQRPGTRQLPRIESLRSLLEEDLPQEPTVIDKVLRQTEVMNIVAASKVRKSWLTIGLAYSVATGRKWLDRFDTVQGRVLVIDNELTRGNFRFRAKAIGEAMGIAQEQADSIDFMSMRGNLHSYRELDAIQEPIVQRGRRNHAAI